ncbi:hypothetical protein [Lacihabitans sp. CCS-44]|nr:hypothetical protein [Lacihabitans sp. CCS-44]
MKPKYIKKPEDLIFGLKLRLHSATRTYSFLPSRMVAPLSHYSTGIPTQ